MAQSPGRRWPVVILNMHYTGLGIARSLRHLPCDIHALSARRDVFGNYSRLSRFTFCPDTETQPSQCLSFLLDFATQFELPPLLLPTRDLDVLFIVNHRAALEARYRIVAPATAVMQTILNKEAMDDTVRAHGIDCPRTVWLNTRADLERFRSELVFPAIAKPVVASNWRATAVWEAVGRRKAVLTHSFQELAAFYQGIEPLAPRMQVQEYVPGPDHRLAIFGSYHNPASGALHFFTGRKLLQIPAGSGTGIAVRAEPVPEIVEPSMRLLRALSYHGISEIEYKLDERTRSYRYIEMNPRHWDQHRLGEACGVNVSRALVADVLLGETLQQVQRARPVTWIAEDGYLLAFFANVVHRQHSFREFFHALNSDVMPAVFEWRDWRPSVILFRELAAQIFRGIWHWLRSTLSGGSAHHATTKSD